MLNISASPFWIGKRELRRDMLASIARQHKVPVALVNQVGGNDSLVFDGSSLVLNREGNVIAQGQSFEEDLIYFDSDRLDRRNARADRRRGGQRVFRPGAGHARLRAQVRILSKRSIGLSGGIDSALTAVIAADAVGPENVIGVGMPGPYSSPGSIDDARALATESRHSFRAALRSIPLTKRIDGTLQRRFCRHDRKTSPKKTFSPALGACC